LAEKTPIDAPLDFEVMSPDDPRAIEAFTKSSAHAVHYMPSSGKDRCQGCAMFKPAPKREDGLRTLDDCTSVRGMIFPDWVCDLFEPVENLDKPIAEDAKMTKGEVKYRLGTPTDHCGICTMFREPDQCTAVEGEIGRHMVCDLFEALERFDR